MMGQWVKMGHGSMSHIYDGSDGSWVTKSDPWSTLVRTPISTEKASFQIITQVQLYISSQERI